MRYWIGRLFLACFGWRTEGTIPSHDKVVMIAAPHTSNWDFPFMMAAAFVFGVRLSWLGKHTLFEGPFGWFMRSLGGVPVDRRAPGGLVGQLVERFAQANRLILVVPAQGTRKKTAYWKSGFYHIAAGAGVPIYLGYLDYARKRAGIGPYVVPSGDLGADMERIRAFYRDVRGKFPASETVPRLREEDEPAPGEIRPS